MRNTSSFPREYLKLILLVGKTPTAALQSDPRFSFSLYVPDAHYMPTPDSPKLPLVVVIHGTRREYLAARDVLQPLADDRETACAILAPLFPMGITGPEDTGSYKFLVANMGDKVEGSETLRYDEILLSMVAEAAARYPGIDTSSFLLAGFSGGGQFAHRFSYLHPDRVIAASVGAPGSITLLDDSLPWPQGTSGMNDAFSGFTGVDLPSLRKTSFQILVGDKDTDTRQFTIAKSVEKSNRDERPRLEKAQILLRNWQSHGLNVRLSVVPGAAHASAECAHVLKPFLAEVLQKLHVKQEALS